MRYIKQTITLIGFLIVGVSSVYAHANLVRSVPASNEQIAQSPSEIRLFFTEPLESQFSQIELRNTQGETLDLSPSQVDVDDNKQLVLPINDPLSDGVYTASWRVISQTDGHLTQGSFPITIGTATQTSQSQTAIDTDNVPLGSAYIRWINLLSLALLVGCISYLKFIWFPNQAETSNRSIIRLKQVIWFGWLSLGLSSILILLLQVSIVTGSGLLPEFDSLIRVVQGTRFGSLWLVRIGLWLVVGFLVWRVDLKQARNLWALLLASGGILLTQSLFSHASGATDTLSAVIADWLHLFAMSIWVGGLVQLIVSIRSRQPDENLGRTIAYFSNMARVAVALLVITGMYATWLQVGSITALLTTAYGQALLIKLLLFIPLLGLGGINLLITSRQLHKKNIVWTTRLRYLMITEIVMAIGIMLAVGVMTAVAPARLTVASQATPASEPNSNNFFEMAFDDDMMIHLSIEPGIVGENTFDIDLFDEATGDVIDDASLIRLRFQDKDGNLGESELRPIPDGEGRYTAIGSNLSLAGEWQVRMTIQRPNEFDTVVDFAPEIAIPPTPVAIPHFDPSPEYNNRVIALLGIGVAIIILNLVLLATHSMIQLQSEIMLVSIICGMIILGNGLQLILAPSLNQSELILTDNQPLKMAINSSVTRPWLITKEGDILQPEADNRWQILEVDMSVNDLLLENENKFWVATDEGLYRYQDDDWEQIDALPIDAVTMTHGYIYGLGNDELPRVGAGGLETDMRLLEIPEPDNNATQFEMLGNHSHILLNGKRIYLTTSLGLGWQAIDAPDEITHITIDADGNLLATTASSILRWRWSDANWSTIAQLPNQNLVDDMVVFQGQIYIAMGGEVFQRVGIEWSAVELDDVGYITDMAFQYPDNLWLLDSMNETLFYTNSPESWTSVEIIVQ